jgi:hypothetical protein
MEKFFYDSGIDDVLDIIESRIDYYDCLIRFDKAEMVEFEIIEELELLRDMIKKMKYYQMEE